MGFWSWMKKKGGMRIARYIETEEEIWKCQGSHTFGSKQIWRKWSFTGAEALNYIWNVSISTSPLHSTYTNELILEGEGSRQMESEIRQKRHDTDRLIWEVLTLREEGWNDSDGEPNCAADACQDKDKDRQRNSFCQHSTGRYTQNADGGDETNWADWGGDEYKNAACSAKLKMQGWRDEDYCSWVRIAPFEPDRSVLEPIEPLPNELVSL